MPSVAEYKEQLRLKSRMKQGDPLVALQELLSKKSSFGADEVLGNIVAEAAKEMAKEMAGEIIKKLVNDTEVISAIASVIHKRIPPPRPGKDGHDPKKGVDYFTDKEIKEFIDAVRPRLGQDFFTDADKKKIVEDAAMLARPVRGVDYEIPELNLPEEIMGEDIVKKINSLEVTPDKQIDVKHIKGLREHGTKLSSEGEVFRGGMKLTWNVQLEGAINGSNRIFTVPAGSPSPQDSRFIVSARGALKDSDSGDFTVSDGNRTITFTTAPPTGSARPRIPVYHAH